MSPRTQERMENLVCCNLSGLPGGGLFRDKVIEICVRKVKTRLRNLHMSLNDKILDKSISSLSTINKIVDHDMRSMLTGETGMQSSYDHIGDDAREYMKEKIEELDPFNLSRSPISLYDKSKGLSPFTGMTSGRIEQFVKRNKTNYKRNHPTKEALDSIDRFRRREGNTEVADGDVGYMEVVEEQHAGYNHSQCEETEERHHAADNGSFHAGESQNNHAGRNQSHHAGGSDSHHAGGSESHHAGGSQSRHEGGSHSHHAGGSHIHHSGGSHSHHAGGGNQSNHDEGGHEDGYVEDVQDMELD